MINLTKWEEQKADLIISRLSEKIPNPSCPMCGNTTFVLQDGLVVNILQENISKLKMGGMSIPSVMTICNKCGFISYHALGALGLMDEFREAKPEEKKV